MSAHFTVLADERFTKLRGELLERLRLAANALAAEGFADFLDPLMRGVLTDGFRHAQATEGTLWLVDGPKENLVPVFNSGPRAADFVGQFRQPLSAGMISLVFASEQPLCENVIATNSHHDKTLDERLGLRTTAMIAVPLYFGRQPRGVISCVQLSDAAAAPGFSMQSLATVQLATSVLSRLIDYRLLAATTGCDSP